MFNNSCLASAFALQPPTVNAPQTFLADCPKWVIDTTDSVWSPGRAAGDVNRSLHEYFYQGWETTSTYGKKLKGFAELEKAVWNTKRAFPDLRIHITDVTCVGNDVDGYKTIMPDVLIGTHSGFSEMYGAPTGKTAQWSGLAFCYVQRVGGKWQYVAEWVVHDELATALQLGVAHKIKKPTTRAEPHDCAGNLPSWGWQPPAATKDADTLMVAAAAAPSSSPAGGDKPDTLPAPPAGAETPLGKRIVMDMDALISAHVHMFEWESWRDAMAPFWTDAPVYDSTVGTGGVTVGLRDWFFGEHTTWNNAFTNVHFNQLVFAGEEASATTTTYALVTWKGDFAGVAPSDVPEHNKVRVRICDFYKFEGERISYNWMMLDVADIMRASGRRVLPHAAALPDDGTFLPPRAMDGLPAPLSAYASPAAAEAGRAVAAKLLAAEWGGPAGDSSALWHADDMLFYGPSGVGLARGYAQYRRHVLGPRWAAFGDAQRFELDQLVCEGAFCGAHGYLVGQHVGCYLGERPATDESGRAVPRDVRLRVGMHWHIVDGKALDGYAFYDTPALFEQLGVDLLARASDPANHPLPSACPADFDVLATPRLVTTTMGATAASMTTGDGAPAVAAAWTVVAAAFACGTLMGGLFATLVEQRAAAKRLRPKLAAPLLESWPNAD